MTKGASSQGLCGARGFPTVSTEVPCAASYTDFTSPGGLPKNAIGRITAASVAQASVIRDVPVPPRLPLRYVIVLGRVPGVGVTRLGGIRRGFVLTSRLVRRQIGTATTRGFSRDGAPPFVRVILSTIWGHKNF